MTHGWARVMRRRALEVGLLVVVLASGPGFVQVAMAVPEEGGEGRPSGEASDTGFTETGSCVGAACPSGGAVALPGGKVLAFGTSLDEASPASELYDPVSGTWTATEPCEGCGSSRPSVTLLGSGEVLVAGGRDETGRGTAAAFLFSPDGDGAGGSWRPAGEMQTPRVAHSATVLADGRVLVAGGCNLACSDTGNDDPTAESELYDPATGQWSPTGAMNSARYFHTATLLDEEVGGCGDNCGKVLVAAGSSGGRDEAGTFAVYDTAELYDPSTGTWELTGSLGSSRFDHTATQLPDGKVLAVGGTAQPPILNTAELYDPASGSWDPNPSILAFARRGHAMSPLPGGNVLVVGGAREGGNSAEMYDWRSQRWNPAGDTVHSWFGATATLLAVGPPEACGDNCGAVLIAGGASEVAELYHSGTSSDAEDGPSVPPDAGGTSWVWWAVVAGLVAVVAAVVVVGLRRRGPR